MRSSAPRVDDKYGTPLHLPIVTRPYDPITYSTLRGAAPPFSPASGPALQQPLTFAPPLRGDALHDDDGHGDWDLGQDSAESLDVRAPRDVFDEPNKFPRPDERVGAHNHRTPSPASARLSHAVPQDVVTSMALSLGAPARPSRADGSARRPATMSEVFVSAPMAGAVTFGESAQSYGRMCDLLFFGDEMPVALAVVELLPRMGQARGHEAGTAGQDRVLSCLLGVFKANDQMNRLLRACAQQQIKQSKTRKDLLQDDCASKRIILSYVIMVAGDFFHRLIAPTVRALQGPWTATTEAGLKGALDRVLSKLASISAPHEMQTALKTVYACLSKKYGSRALGTLAFMLIGELFGATLRNICTTHQVEALTTDGARFLESMASVLAKLSLNESFAGSSKLYHMNGWIQSRYEGFEKSMHKLLDVEVPPFTPWNSGCAVDGPMQNMHTLLHALMEHKEEILRICMSQVCQPVQSSHQSRILMLWAALEGTRRRGTSEHIALNSSRSPDKELHADANSHTGLLGQMSKIVSDAKSGSKVPTLKNKSNRMEHLSATVTDMDLSSRRLVSIPKLDHFKNLRALNISRNGLTELGDLPSSLCTIDCSHNQLSELSGLRGLKNLVTLNASHNLFQDLMSQLVDTYRIRSLDLSHNELSAVVDCSSMLELCHLSIGHNFINSVQDLRNLALNSNLRSIAVEGNPLCLEVGYFKHLAMMLPQLTSIDEASIMSAHYCPQFSSAEQLWSQSNSTKRPDVSPLLEPALLSPRTHAQVSPFLKPGAANWQSKQDDVPSLEQVDRVALHISPICKHDLSIPCVVRDDENEVEGFGAKNFEPVGLNDWPNVDAVSPLSTTKHPVESLQTSYGQVDAATSIIDAPPARVSNVTLKLDVEFYAVGSECSRKRAKFISDLAQDLENASGLPKECFLIKSVAPGSVLVNLDICAHGAYCADEVAHDLKVQFQDPFSALRTGVITRNLEAVTISSSMFASPPPRNDGALLDILWQERETAKEQAAPEGAFSDTHNACSPATDQILSTGAGRVTTLVAPHKAGLSTQSTVEHDNHDRPSSVGAADSHSSIDKRLKSGPGGPTLSHIPSRGESTSARNGASPQPLKASSARPNSRHTTRIASSNVQKNKTPRQEGPKPKQASPPKVAPLSCALSAETDLALTNLFASNSALDASMNSGESSIQYDQVNIAEMVMKISDELKVMGLVFRGWKLVLGFSRLTLRLARPHSHLLLVSGARYRGLLLRQFWGPWADMAMARRHRVRNLDAGGRVARARLAAQLLHEWRALSRFRHLFATRMRRRQCAAARIAMSSWLHVAMVSRAIKARIYRLWRQRGAALGGIVFEAWKGKQRESNRLMVVKRRICRLMLNRKVGIAFEAFAEIRDRAHRIECDVSVAVKRMQIDTLGEFIVAWRHSVNRRTHVSAFVTKVCSRFFTVDLGVYFRAWRGRIACRSLLVVFSRHVLSRKESMRLVELLRAWRLLIFGPAAQNKVVDFCKRRRQAASRRKCLQRWVGLHKSFKQQDAIDHRCAVMMTRARRARQAVAFNEWRHHQALKRQHGVAVLRALHRRRVRCKHATFARLRNTAMMCKVRYLADEMIHRKEMRRSVRDLFQGWHGQVRRKRALSRRVLLVTSKQSKSGVRNMLYAWHDVAHRRFQVAAMLDKILLKRKQQHASPESHGGRGPRPNTSSSYPQQPITSPRRSESGN